MINLRLVPNFHRQQAAAKVFLAFDNNIYWSYIPKKDLHSLFFPINPSGTLSLKKILISIKLLESITGFFETKKYENPTFKINL